MPKKVSGVEEIAAEVGRLLGTTEVHARKWLDQRKELVNALSVLRDKASALISELGEAAGSEVRKRRGKKADEGIPVIQPGMRESRKKRVISAQTRGKMRAAAKKRWAAITKRRSRQK